MTRFIPAEARPYKSTAIFTQDTVPDALRKDHSTKAGVWALIHVTKGRLLYIICDPAAPPATFELSDASGAGIVLPQEKHHVELVGDVEFYVEFFAVPETDAATESVSQIPGFGDVHSS